MRASRRLRGGLLLFGALIMVTLWAAVWEHTHALRKRAMDQAHSDVRNLARAIDAQLSSTIDGVDQALMEVATQVGAGHSTDLAAFARRSSVLRNGIALQVAVVNQDGWLVDSSLGMPPEPMNFLDREHFQVHRTNAREGLYIGKPLVGRRSQRWSIQFTRRIEDADGRFRGIVVVSVDPEYFSNLFNAIDLGENGVITLVGLDGAVRARVTNRDAFRNGDMSGGRIFEELAKSPEGTYTASSRLDGIERVFGYRLLREQPMVVIVGLSKDEVLGASRELDRLAYAIAVVGSLLIVGAVLALNRYARRLNLSRVAAERARAETTRLAQLLRDAMNGMSEGIMIWDAQDRLAMVNDRIRHAEPDLMGELESGRTFEEVLRRRVGEGIIRDAVGREEEYIQLRLSQHAHPTGEPIYHARSDGRWIRLCEHRTAEGGVVVVRSDVTEEKRREEELILLASTDPLTGLLNRRAFMEGARVELDRSRRHERAASLLILDIDHFKQVNDTHGHDVGDTVLKRVAGLLRIRLRSTDVIARIGGEEFAIVMPETELEAAGSVAETLRIAMRKLDLEGRAPVTASIGVASLSEAPTVQAALILADRALYEAKNTGRDRVVVHGSEGFRPPAAAAFR